MIPPADNAVHQEEGQLATGFLKDWYVQKFNWFILHTSSYYKYDYFLQVAKYIKFTTTFIIYLQAQQQQPNSRLDRMVTTQQPVFMEEICEDVERDPCDHENLQIQEIMGECNNLG